jgi:hypothetical protein
LHHGSDDGGVHVELAFALPVPLRPLHFVVEGGPDRRFFTRTVRGAHDESSIEAREATARNFIEGGNFDSSNVHIGRVDEQVRDFVSMEIDGARCCIRAPTSAAASFTSRRRRSGGNFWK